MRASAPHPPLRLPFHRIRSREWINPRSIIISAAEPPTSHLEPPAHPTATDPSTNVDRGASVPFSHYASRRPVPPLGTQMHRRASLVLECPSLRCVCVAGTVAASRDSSLGHARTKAVVWQAWEMGRIRAYHLLFFISCCWMGWVVTFHFLLAGVFP